MPREEWKSLLSSITMPSDSFDFPRRWNSLERSLLLVVFLWRLCSSRRLASPRLASPRLASTATSIGWGAFYDCESKSSWWIIEISGVTLPFIPAMIIDHTLVIHILLKMQVWRVSGVMMVVLVVVSVSVESRNGWLSSTIQLRFNKLYYNSFTTTKHINNYLNENGNNTALQCDAIHGMTPLFYTCCQ